MYVNVITHFRCRKEYRLSLVQAASDMELAMTYISSAVECVRNNDDVIVHNMSKLDDLLTMLKNSVKGLNIYMPELKQSSIVKNKGFSGYRKRIVSSGTVSSNYSVMLIGGTIGQARSSEADGVIDLENVVIDEQESEPEQSSSAAGMSSKHRRDEEQ